MRFLGDHDGASALEFAVVAPLFVLMVCGILAYGMYFGAVHSVQQLAADAARSAVAGKNDTERIALASEAVTENGANYPLLDADGLAVAASIEPIGAGKQIVVSVRYDASGLPLWQLKPLVPLPSQVIERTAVARMGGY